MSVQVSTRIDEATKQQFDKVCETIGISASNVLSMLIRGVVNDNCIPTNVVTPPEKEVPSQKPSKLPYGFGCMKGKIWMADDFDAPLEDFEEYM